MKNLLTICFAIVAMSGDALAQGKKFSEYPNASTLQSGDLFIFSRAGAGTFNIDAFSQLPTALGLGTAAYTATTAYDAAGQASAATNGYPWGALYEPAGRAVAVTNGFPWGVLYDPAGRAVAVTNGFPWGVLYDPAGSALNATNNFQNGRNLTNLLHGPTVSGVSGVSVALTQNSDGSTNYGLTVTAGGSGTVTSVGLTAPSEFSVAGSPVTGAGTLAITRTADANFLGLAATNIGFLKITNTASIAGQAGISALVLTNGFTNQALTASTLLKADANKGLTSIANPSVASFTTNDSSGNIGYTPMTDYAKTNQLIDATTLTANHHVATGATTNLEPWEDATGYTNLVAWTHEGTTTNITATFNGTLQSFTVTNGPTVFFHYAGANGSISYRIYSTNFTTLALDFQPKWLAGSNNVITNGVLSFTSYGGTNMATPAQLEAAIKENQ